MPRKNLLIFTATHMIARNIDYWCGYATIKLKHHHTRSIHHEHKRMYFTHRDHALLFIQDFWPTHKHVPIFHNRHGYFIRLHDTLPELPSKAPFTKSQLRGLFDAFTHTLSPTNILTITGPIDAIREYAKVVYLSARAYHIKLEVPTTQRYGSYHRTLTLPHSVALALMKFITDDADTTHDAANPSYKLLHAV